MKKKIIVLVIAAILITALCGCRESSRVNYNLSKEADNFNVSRRLTVLNARTDNIMMELVGNFSLSNNSENELVVTVEINPNCYKKHYIYLNDWVLYVVEDLSGSDVSQYNYELNFLPDTIPVFDVTEND